MTPSKSLTWHVWLEWAPFKRQLRDLSHVSLPIFLSFSMSDENSPPSAPVYALKLAKRKTPCVGRSVLSLLTNLLWLSCPGDPFVHHGWRFGRTVHAMCNVHALICNGIGHLGKELVPEESLTYELDIVFFSSQYLWANAYFSNAGIEKSVECSNNFCRPFPALKSGSSSLSKRTFWLLPNLYVLYCSLFWTNLLFFEDSERCFQCTIWWYQESKGGSFGLDIP